MATESRVSKLRAHGEIHGKTNAGEILKEKKEGNYLDVGRGGTKEQRGEMRR